MKYCSECKVIYEDSQEKCPKCHYSQLRELPIEAKCSKCGSREGLRYSPSWKISQYEYGNYCECEQCRRKLQEYIEREEQMKYLILDKSSEEQIFCDNNGEVEGYLSSYAREWEGDNGRLDMVILKLYPLKEFPEEKDFKEPHNTHLVIYDYEIYKVERAITPSLDYDGERTVNW